MKKLIFMLALALTYLPASAVTFINNTTTATLHVDVVCSEWSFSHHYVVKPYAPPLVITDKILDDSKLFVHAHAEYSWWLYKPLNYSMFYMDPQDSLTLSMKDTEYLISLQKN